MLLRRDRTERGFALAEQDSFSPKEKPVRKGHVEKNDQKEVHDLVFNFQSVLHNLLHLCTIEPDGIIQENEGEETMSQTVTLRLPDGVAEWFKASARRAGRSANDLGVSLFVEAQRTSEFAEIEFRTFGGERQACLKGLLQVWQVVEAAQQYGLDAEKTAQHFGWPVWKVQAALNYYEAFPHEIDAAIAENKAMDYEKLKRLFPHMRLVEVTLPSEEALASHPKVGE